LSFILFRMPMRALCENVYDVISPLWSGILCARKR
jgi:hypothetical protein